MIYLLQSIIDILQYVLYRKSNQLLFLYQLVLALVLANRVAYCVSSLICVSIISENDRPILLE